MISGDGGLAELGGVDTGVPRLRARLEQRAFPAGERRREPRASLPERKRTEMMRR